MEIMVKIFTEYAGIANELSSISLKLANGVIKTFEKKGVERASVTGCSISSKDRYGRYCEEGDAYVIRFETEDILTSAEVAETEGSTVMAYTVMCFDGYDYEERNLLKGLWHPFKIQKISIPSENGPVDLVFEDGEKAHSSAVVNEVDMRTIRKLIKMGYEIKKITA